MHGDSTAPTRESSSNFPLDIYTLKARADYLSSHSLRRKHSLKQGSIRHFSSVELVLTGVYTEVQELNFSVPYPPGENLGVKDETHIIDYEIHFSLAVPHPTGPNISRKSSQISFYGLHKECEQLQESSNSRISKYQRPSSSIYRSSKSRCNFSIRSHFHYKQFCLIPYIPPLFGVWGPDLER